MTDTVLDVLGSKGGCNTTLEDWPTRSLLAERLTRRELIEYSGVGGVSLATLWALVCQPTAPATTPTAAPAAHDGRGAPLPQIRRDPGDLYRASEKQFGAADCRTVTRYDFSAPEGDEAFRESGTRQAKCNGCAEFVVRHAADRTGDKTK
jgi:hypothetical protein